MQRATSIAFLHGSQAHIFSQSSACPVSYWLGVSPGQIRNISEENLGSGGQAQIDDAFERQMRGASRKKEHGVPHLLLTTRRESLALYREILRYSNLFVWKDQQGRRWRDLIRESTRKEFEEARFEADPALVNRLIITGRDAMHRTVEAFMQKWRQIIEEEDNAKNQWH